MSNEKFDHNYYKRNTKKIKQLKEYYEEKDIGNEEYNFVCNKCLGTLSTYDAGKPKDRAKSMKRARYLLALEHLGKFCSA
ncbi:MAG: hypothetical protein KJI71_01245 [Patescibacteria group bacterium]|nr:hypothetical protein [Patescibacteria group bacterium]